MNKERRKELSNLVRNISDLHEKLNSILEDEQNYYDNMPENLQCSSRADESEEAIEMMEEALEHLKNANECLEDI